MIRVGTYAGALALMIAVTPAVSMAAAKSAHSHGTGQNQVLKGRSIWIDKAHQRLFAFSGTHLVLEAKCSTAAHKPKWARGDKRKEMPSTPSGTFHIVRKNAYFWSKTYKVHMLDAMFFSGGRAIHATPVSEYRYLGTPESGGCVRLTRQRGRALFFWARKGDTVHVVHSLPHPVAAAIHLSPAASPLLHKRA